MIHVKDTRHPAGTAILAAGIYPRYYEFQLSLDHVLAPVGSKLVIERGCDITRNFNHGIRKMVGDWAWFLGDDHSFDEGLLMRLLDYDVDVVVPVTPTKMTPWLPCIMHGPDVPKDGKYWEEEMAIYQWDEISGTGLLPLPEGDFIGQAGMLVKKRVLDKIGYPWFKCGQMDPGYLQEDMYFCHELQKLGYTVHVAQDEIFNHFMPMGISARRYQGRWCPALLVGNKTMVLPDAKPQFSHEEANTNRGSGISRVKFYNVPRTPDDITSVQEL